MFLNYKKGKDLYLGLFFHSYLCCHYSDFKFIDIEIVRSFITFNVLVILKFLIILSSKSTSKYKKEEYLLKLSIVRGLNNI